MVIPDRIIQLQRGLVVAFPDRPARLPVTRTNKQSCNYWQKLVTRYKWRLTLFIADEWYGNQQVNEILDRCQLGEVTVTWLIKDWWFFNATGRHGMNSFFSNICLNFTSKYAWFNRGLWPKAIERFFFYSHFSYLQFNFKYIYMEWRYMYSTEIPIIMFFSGFSYFSKWS